MAPSAECAVLEFEVQNLREELRSYDEQLPCWAAEARAAETYAEALEARSASEARLVRPASPCSSEGERDYNEAFEHYAEQGLHVHDFEDPVIHFAGLTDEEIHNRHQERGQATKLS